MDVIRDGQKYISNSEKIKYVAIAVCSVLTLQVLFKDVQNKLSLLIQLLVIGSLIYILLKYDIQKKKDKETLHCYKLKAYNEYLLH